MFVNAIYIDRLQLIHICMDFFLGHNGFQLKPITVKGSEQKGRATLSVIGCGHCLIFLM
jgi:hypothetical protein